MIENRRPVTLAVTVIMLSLSTIFVGARLFTRTWMVRKVQLDDWFIFAAWVLALGFSVSICAGTAVGLGAHEVDIPPEHHSPLRKTEYAFSVLYNPALMVRAHIIFIRP
jgi:hypothetical protein